MGGPWRAADGAAKGGAKGGADGQGDGENSSAPRAVARAVATAAQGLRTATRPNRKYGAGTILVLVALAASNGTPAGGFPGLGEYAGTAGRMPTAGRARQAMQARDAGVALRRRGAAPPARVGRAPPAHAAAAGGPPAEIVVALDMHGICRYGRAIPRWLVRARSDHGPARRERHTAAQCAANRRRVTPGAVRVMPGDSVEAAFSTVCRRVRAACARAGVRPVLLVDRGHFMAGVLGRLARHRVRWPVPCPNSRRVAAALRDFTAGRRGVVSRMRISDGRRR